MCVTKDKFSCCIAYVYYLPINKLIEMREYRPIFCCYKQANDQYANPADPEILLYKK